MAADYTEDGLVKAVREVGPRGCTMTAEEIANHAAAKEFRMFDDDKVLYYTGYCILPDGLTERAFDPLDDYGTPNAGATEIQYKNEKGEWVTL